MCNVSADDGGRVGSLTVGSTNLLIRPRSFAARRGVGQLPDGAVGRTHPQRPVHASTVSTTSCRSTSKRTPSTAPGSNSRGKCVDRDAQQRVLRCGLAWVLGGEAEQLIELADDSLMCTLTVRAGDNPMPASIGWHPWFVKPERVDLRFDRMYLRDDDYITDGRTVSPPPPPPWDDCFAGPLATPRLWIGDVEVSITSDCDYWVVYDMPAHATCVEPQTATRLTALQPRWRSTSGTGRRVAPHHDDRLDTSADVTGGTPRCNPVTPTSR